MYQCPLPREPLLPGPAVEVELYNGPLVIRSCLTVVISCLAALSIMTRRNKNRHELQIQNDLFRLEIHITGCLGVRGPRRGGGGVVTQ